MIYICTAKKMKACLDSNIDIEGFNAFTCERALYGDFSYDSIAPAVLSFIKRNYIETNHLKQIHVPCIVIKIQNVKIYHDTLFVNSLWLSG